MEVLNKEMHYFEHDRYRAEEILAAYEKTEKEGNSLVVHVSSDLSFEIYSMVKNNRSYVREILTHLPQFDQSVQSFCEESYKKGRQDYKNYIVELAYINMEQDEVAVHYWGKYVNIELEAICRREGINWKVESIYFC